MATLIEPIERVVGAFSDNPTYDELVHKLAEIAATWRSTQALDLIPRYNAVLQCLAELGFDEALDVEVRLPKKFMSLEYRQHQWREHVPAPETVKE